MSLTIFTPVYNRTNLIHKLYESLVRQSNQNFIWLIVDDGSTDNIKQIIDGYRSSAKFEIKYIYQENAGKHSAHNTGVENCKTELFFCVDSDDYLTDDAVESIYSEHEKYRSQKILGYYFRKKDTQNQISGVAFSFEKKFVGLRELYFKYGFIGELAIVLKTDLIKHFSFPVYKNEKFVSEKVFYNQITSIAPMVYIDKVIYVFEYQETGYTMNSNRLLAKNPIGGAMGYLSDAIYGMKFIDKAKSFGAFLSMKKVFEISDKEYPMYNISIFVRFAGYMLKHHYNKLFKRIALRYNEEEK